VKKDTQAGSDNLRRGKPNRGESAGGLRALSVTLQHAQTQTGIPRALRVLSRANQRSGFDCPGCAWPEPEVRSFAEFCENGAKAILDEATNARVGREFFARHSIAELLNQSEGWLNAQGRITEPMILRPGAGHYEPISYEGAYEIISEQLHALASPHEAAFYTSGRTSNEAAFLYQLFVRSFGTNNLPDCSNLCHESSGVALKESIGIGKGTARLDDFQQADLIFVVGQNPGTNHPRMLSTLREAKLRGATIVCVNPLVELGLVRFAHPQVAEDLLTGGVDISDEFVRVCINGDQAFFRGLSKALLESPQPDAVDRAFIQQYTAGASEFERIVRATTWQEIETKSGITRGRILQIADLVLSSRNIISSWAMGLTQHQNAVATIQELVNFMLLRGNIGRAGAGVCPVRGHSNVQGDRTMGIVPVLAPEFTKALELVCGVAVPSEPGLDTVGTITEMAAGRVRALISLGGHFLSASPDTHFTAEALKKCDLTVQISTKLNRSHLVTGKTAIILPCLGRTERDEGPAESAFVTVENSMGVIHPSAGKLPPVSPHLRSEARIVAQIAAEVLKGEVLTGEALRDRTPSSAWPQVEWSQLGSDYDAIRDIIARVVPGCEGYNHRVRNRGGFEIENGPRERRFTTGSGKAHFFAASLNSIEARPGELLLMTVRSHDQFNTTVYSDEDRYRGMTSRKVILLNVRDLHERGITSGQEVLITSLFEASDGSGESTRTLAGFRALAYDVPRGSAVAYFPEANPLIFVGSYADRSRTPTSKSIRIRVEGSLGHEPGAV